MLLTPLYSRLNRACFLGLLLGLWGGTKIVWEEDISQQQNELRYGQVAMTRALRDQLGQGLSIALLSGMRSVVADVCWLYVTEYWEDQDWVKMDTFIEICTYLQPRTEFFWSEGGEHLSADAACTVLNDSVRDPNPYSRSQQYLFWVNKGKDLFIRGTENLPDSFEIWRRLALVYQERLHDVDGEAAAYQRSADCPGAPVFLERFSARAFDAAHRDQQAYDAWCRLYRKLSPEELRDPIHWGDAIEKQIKMYETKLNVPKEKRIFP